MAFLTCQKAVFYIKVKIKVNSIKILTGTAHPHFAQQVARQMNLPLCECQVSRFTDGEVQVHIRESIRGCHVFILQGTSPPVNENYMELFIMMDAVRRASAQEITVVMPYYGYGRQDRKAAARTPISAKCVADLLQVSGAKRLLVVDLHAPQIQGFFKGPVDNLFAWPVMARTWKEQMKDKNPVCVSPDAGALERTRAFAKKIQSPIAVIDKRRPEPGIARAFHVVGDIKDKTALIIDDMIDTGGTLTAAAEKLLQKGAKEVYAMATHAVFSGSALQLIENSPLKEVWVTDTIPLRQKAKKIRCVSVAPLVAEAIRRIDSKGSVSAMFD